MGTGPRLKNAFGTGVGNAEQFGIAMAQRGVTPEMFQKAVADKDRGDVVAAALRGELLAIYTHVNPHADKIVPPAWNYPPEWPGMTSWEEQLDVLRTFLPKLNPDGLPETAQSYLEQKGLWAQTFEREGYDQSYPLYDGLVVFALPGAAAAKLGFGDLWADVAKGREGQGLWGRLCEEVLFPQFTLPTDNPRFPGFYNCRQGQMGSDRFLPPDSLAQWFKELEQQTAGDFACRPFNFGRRLAGDAVEASWWEVEHLLDGLVSPTWTSSQALLTNPSRLPRYGTLAIDCDDRYRFGDNREFLSAPHFCRLDDRLEFCSGHVEGPDGRYGAAFVRR